MSRSQSSGTGRASDSTPDFVILIRIVSWLLAVIAVLLLGRVLYELIQFTVLAWDSLLLGLAAAIGAGLLHRKSRPFTNEVTDSGELIVRAVDAAAVRPLRSLVLRPGQPPEALVYEHDDHPLTLHAAAFEGDEIVGIATVYPEIPPQAQRGQIPDSAYGAGASFRLRGMASHPRVRGRGAGRAVLERCFEHIRAHDAAYLWCNARLGALGFYEGMGFETVGDEFDIPGIGPHYVMWRRV
jgi:GNAT superfamily N-acetyltransferase